MTNPLEIERVKQESGSGPLGAAFLLLITKMYFEKSHILCDHDYPKDYTARLLNDKNPIFDFIIVGAGTAGSVLANRLSETGKWSILVLEAGVLPSETSEVPAFYHHLRGTNEHWNFITQQETNACQGFQNKRCRIFRGRVLGGTSSINDLHYMRGMPTDFLTWSHEIHYGWLQDNITTNYKIHENRHPKCDGYKEYGIGGELGLDRLNEENEIKCLIYDGAEEMGYNRVSSGQYLGYFDVLGTVRHGSRDNFAKAFFRSIKDRENLAVARNIQVTKVLTQIPKDHRIQGVEAYVGTKNITIKARKEVILTTGAINTAQLLMLSGFGPKEHLKKHNIPVLVDLPVGKNLRDQVTTLLFVSIDKNKSEDYDSSDKYMEDVFSFMLRRRGDLTHTNINDVVGLINTKNASAMVPNIAIYHYFFKKNQKDLYTYLKNLGLVGKITSSIVKQNKQYDLILFMPTVIKPKSRGEVELQSNSPFKAPAIIGNYLSDQSNEDYQTLLSGAKYVLSLIETEPFKKIDAKFLEVDMPNCRNFKYCNEPYLACAVKNMAIPRSQIIGTASMGDVRDCCRVTDQYMLLDGIRHLRIVDGSVIPEHITGNLEPTVGMMAENAAQQIKKHWSI